MGAMTDPGVHKTDLIQYLLDDPYGEGEVNVSGYGAGDPGIDMRFPNGTIKEASGMTA